jgi:hypothetical protein
MKFMTLGGFYYMCKETEIITQGEEGILMDFDLVLGIEIRQDPSVLPQQAMHIPYKIVGIAVQLVIVVIPALIRTEFFIGAATYRVAAIETFLFHSTNISIKV